MQKQKLLSSKGWQSGEINKSIGGCVFNYHAVEALLHKE